MRVVLVNRYASSGAGAEKHVVGLARALRSSGHEVRVLSTAADDNVEVEGAFVPLTGTDFWRGQPPLRRRAMVAANALWNRSAAAAMGALVREFRPDVVHAHDLYPQLSAAPVTVAAGAGVPVVQTLHNYELISALPTDHRGALLDTSEAPLAVRTLRTALRLARGTLHRPGVDRWIAVSRFVAAVYADHGIRAEVLPNFVDSDSAADTPGYEERHGVVFVGRLTEEKGAADAIGLARRVPGLSVTIVGRGPLEDRARAEASRLGNLDYAGFVDAAEVRARLRAARVCVVPSRWQEPAGLVALEAMAEGTPVVAYDSGGLAEYVSDAGGGEVVAPSEADLARASQELDGRPDRWAELSRRGRAAVERDHSPQGYVQRLEQVYRRALAAAPGG